VRTLVEPDAVVKGADPRIGDRLDVGEELVKVPRTGKDGSPGSQSAGAVVQRAQHSCARGVLRRFQQLGPGRRPRDLHRREDRDPAVALVSWRKAVAAGTYAFHRHDRPAERGHLDLHVRPRRCLLVPVREHDLRIGELVVHPEHTLGASSRDERDVVAVVAELASLRRWGLRVEVEAGRALQDRLAPADKHLPRVPAGDNDVVEYARLDWRERQGWTARA
jgi:hypothetical protein